MAWLTIPNAISIVRLLLVPVFLWLRLTGRPEWALAVFVIAAVSDVVDGFLARVLNQRSKLGGLLDPIADKLLVFTAVFALVIAGGLPWWLLILLLVRDATMLVGAAVVRHKHLDIPTRPSRIGKYATFALVLTVVLGLGASSPRAPPEVQGYVVAVAFISALCVVISYLQYWARFGYLFFVPERKQSSVDEKRTPR
ncbi:MAG: CDP-alcohol phosphatidyltransferase family protein [Myxococcaceae bacterium]